MRLKKVKILLFIAVAGISFSASGFGSRADTLSSLLPSAGFGTKVEGGVTVSEVKDEVKHLVDESQGNSTSVVKLDDTSATTARQTVTPDKEVVEAVIPEVAVEEKKEEELSYLVIAQVDNYVNVRSIPGEDGEIVGKLYDKSVGDYLGEEDGWYKIRSGNCTGYVKAEYCVVGDEAKELAKEVGTRLARVNTTTLKVREEAGLDASVLGLVAIDDELVVLEENDGWAKVDIEEGYGYVSLEYVDLHTEFVRAESKEEEEARLKKEKEARDKANAAARAAQRAQQNAEAQASQSTQAAPATTYTASGDSAGASVANYALQFVGNPYVFGGSSLTNGTDCSGFVMSVYANFGVSLPHSSSGDRSVGYDVGGLENAQPGDIVCYSGHVGIYIGNGQIVHASTSKTGIVVGNATYRTPLCVRRIF
ncbi:MAG: C40 family peptidase [Lachnospiraceae bacterium]|nr:C40 family peptidase [Lachnospiraceae bacterium]